MILKGRFHEWNRTNIAALERVPDGVLRPQSRAVMSLFASAMTAPLLTRLVYLRRSGVYRQTLLGNIGLIAAAIIKRL